MMNKKSQMTILMMVLILGLFLGLLVLLVLGVVSDEINTALNQNISVGSQNLASINADTFGKYNEMIVTSSEWIGMSLIFGLVLGLFLSAFFVRGFIPKWGIILDIFIILFFFIIALYISSAYSLVLDSLASAGITFLEDRVTAPSNFMVNLHIYVVIIGVVIMILFHGSIPRRTEETIQSGGYLQGVQ